MPLPPLSFLMQTAELLRALQIRGSQREPGQCKGRYPLEYVHSHLRTGGFSILRRGSVWTIAWNRCLYIYPGPREERAPVSAQCLRRKSASGISDSVSVQGEGISSEKNNTTWTSEGRGLPVGSEGVLCTPSPESRQFCTCSGMLRLPVAQRPMAKDGDVPSHPDPKAFPR